MPQLNKRARVPGPAARLRTDHRLDGQRLLHGAGLPGHTEGGREEPGRSDTGVRLSRPRQRRNTRHGLQVKLFV